MDKSFVLTSVPIEELLLEIDRLIVRRLADAQQKEIAEKLLSAKEVCTFLKISRPTLAAWVKERRINENRLGAKLYYKYSDVMTALNTIKKYHKTII